MAVCYDLPSISKTDQQTGCSICVDEANFDLKTDTCVYTASLGSEVITLKYSLWQDMLYIEDITPDDRIYQIKFDSTTKTITARGSDLKGKVIPVPPNTTEITFSVGVQVSGSLSFVDLTKFSVAWSGIIKTGIYQITIQSGKITEVQYLDPSEFGVKQIIVSDPADLTGLHIRVKDENGNWVDKYYKFDFSQNPNTSTASVAWDGLGIEVPPLLSLPYPGSLSVIYDDKNVYAFHTGGIVLSGGAELQVKAVYTSSGEADTEQTYLVKPCAGASGCWYVSYSDLVPPKDSYLLRLSVLWNNNENVIIPRQKVLENALGTVSLWKDLMVSVLKVDLQSGNVETEMTKVGNYAPPETGTFLHAVMPVYGAGGNPQRIHTIIRARGTSVDSSFKDVNAYIYDLKYDQNGNVATDSSKISDAQLSFDATNGFGTVEVPESGSIGALVVLDFSDMPYSVTFSGGGVLGKLVDSNGNLENVYIQFKEENGKFVATTPNGDFLAEIDESKAIVVFGKTNKGNVFIPVAVYLTGNYSSGEAEYSFELIYQFKYSPSALLISENGKVTPKFENVPIVVNGNRVITEIPLTADAFAVVVENNNEYVEPFDVDEVSISTVSLSSTVKINFSYQNSEVIDSMLDKLYVYAVIDYSVTYGNSVLQFTKTVVADAKTFATSGIDIYKDVLTISSALKDISEISGITVSVSKVFIGTDEIGYATPTVGVNSSTITVPSINMDYSDKEIIVSGVTSVPSNYQIKLEVCPVSAPFGSDNCYVALINQGTPQLSASTLASNVLANVGFRTPDIFAVKLVLTDTEEKIEWLIDYKITNMLEDFGLVSLTYSSNVNQLMVSVAGLTGVSISAFDSEMNQLTPVTTTSNGAVFNYEPPYVMIVIYPSGNTPDVGVEIFYYQNITVAKPSIKITETLGSYQLSIENFSAEALYRLLPDGTLEEMSNFSITEPGIYLLKGTYIGISGEVESVFVIFVPGYEVIPTQSGYRVIALDYNNEATVTVKEYISFLAPIMDMIGIAKSTETYSGKYVGVDIDEKAVRIGINCCGGTYEFSGISEDEVVKTYAPLVIGGVALLLMRAKS